MGGLSAPAALDNSGTDATPASNPILSFANAMKRASSVPAGTVSAARGGAGGGVGETAGGVGCGWVAITLPAGIITPACGGWQMAAHVHLRGSEGTKQEQSKVSLRAERSQVFPWRLSP